MKEIGGYLNLELRHNDYYLHSDGLKFNLCRKALEFILQRHKETAVWIPYFTCGSVSQAAQNQNININYYSINQQLEIEKVNIKSDDLIIVTNYFGIKDNYIKKIASEYRGHIIVDNAQSYFSEPINGVDTIYSPHKFLGVPDGGIAYIRDIKSNIDLTQDKSFNRCKHLLRRYDESASNGYNDYRDEVSSLRNQNIMRMSKLTEAILENADYKFIKTRRMENFNYLHEKLGSENLLNIDISGVVCPLVYPFYIKRKDLRQKLIENKVYVATYWPHVMELCEKDQNEFRLTENIIPLPIDQRYTIVDMDYIIKIIKD